METDVRGVPLDRSNLCVRAFEQLHPADGVTFRLRSEIPVAAGLGSSAAAIVAGLVAADHMYELDADLLLGCAVESRGASRQRGGCAPRRLRDLRRRASRALRPSRRAGGRAGDPARTRCPPRRRAPRCRPRCRSRTRCTTSRTPALLVLGLARGDSRPRGPRPVRPHPPAAPRAALPALDGAAGARRGELGALGATISGAGPAVLFWSHYEQTGGALRRAAREAPDCKVRRVQFDPSGADVRALA